MRPKDVIRVRCIACLGESVRRNKHPFIRPDRGFGQNHKGASAFCAGILTSQPCNSLITFSAI